MAATIHGQYVDRGEAARMLGITPQRVVQLANEGVLPCVRAACGCRQFAVADVEELRRMRNGSRAEA